MEREQEKIQVESKCHNVVFTNLGDCMNASELVSGTHIRYYKHYQHNAMIPIKNSKSGCIENQSIKLGIVFLFLLINVEINELQ